MLRKGLPYAEILFGTALSGFVSVPLNPEWNEQEITRVINHSDALLLFVDEEFLPLIQLIKNGIPNIEQINIVGKDNHEEGINDQSIYLENFSYQPLRINR